MAKKPTEHADRSETPGGFAETATEWAGKAGSDRAEDTRAALKRLGDQNAEALTRLAER